MVNNRSIEVLFGITLLEDNFWCICEQIARNIKISGTQAIKMLIEVAYDVVQWQAFVLQVNSLHVQKQAMFFTTSY